MDTPFYPGRRLSFEGNLCTVRYIGPVAGTKGQWLGVEWDDPTRGKHSGEHDGKRYFACTLLSLPGQFRTPPQLRTSFHRA